MALTLLEAAKTLTKVQVATVSHLAQKFHAKYTLSLEALIKRYDVHLWLKYEDAVERVGSSLQYKEHIVKELVALGHDYIAIAAALGYERGLRDLCQAGWITWFRQPVQAPYRVYRDSITFNDRYLQTSFGSALADVAHPADMRSRLSMYSHYLWRVAESAYRSCLRDYRQAVPLSIGTRHREAEDDEEFLAVFAGPDDADTCEGCDGAVQDNPYPLDECPQPGEFECMNRCRHFVQLSDNAPDDLAPYEWHGLIGFGSVPVGYYDEVIRDQDLLPRWDIDRYRLDQPYQPSVDGISLPSEGSVLGKLGAGPGDRFELPAAAKLTEIPDTGNIKNLAKWIWDAGMNIDEVGQLLGFDPFRLIDLKDYYDQYQQSQATTATVLTWLRQGNVTKLVSLADNPIFNAIYQALAAYGFPASESTLATILGRILGIEPTYDVETARMVI